MKKKNLRVTNKYPLFQNYEILDFNREIINYYLNQYG